MKFLRLLLILLICSNSFAEPVPSFELRLSSPFHTVSDIYSYDELSERFQDGFGAYRNRGHLHSAQDIAGAYAEAVYPVYSGIVAGIWGRFPYKNVAILHLDKDRKPFYTCSVHLGESYVEVGDYVTRNTKIGRLLNEEEQERAYYSKVHLHFEIRKNLGNKKVSARCYTMKQLTRYFYDPKKFLKTYMD